MTNPDPVPDSLELRAFRATCVVLATLAGAYALWLLTDLLLLLFACALVALILLTITDWTRARMRLPFGVSLGITVVGLLALIAGAFTFFGATMSAQFLGLCCRLRLAG